MPQSLRDHIECLIELLSATTAPEWIMLVPANDASGQVKALDGRVFSNSDPQGIVAAFEADPRDLPIDWNHAEEIKAPKGDESPAAGWIKQLEVRNGAVWGRVEWNERGAASVLSKEYRYISPAFSFKGVKKVIQKLFSAGLVNGPALDMPALARDGVELAAVWTTAYVNDLPDSAFLYVESGGAKDSEGKTKPRTLRHFPYKDASGQIDLPHLRNAIARIPQAKGISDQEKQRLQAKARRLLERQNASEEHAMEPELLKLLGLAEGATPEQIKDAVTGLVDKATAPSQEKLTEELAEARAENKRLEGELANARAANPALERFVPRADYDAVVARAQKAEGSLKDQAKAARDKEVEQLVTKAQQDGKITPATRNFYVQTCSTDEGLANFKKFLETAPEIAKDSGLDDKPVPAKTAVELTADQQRILAQCGVSVEDYRAAQAE